MKIIKILIGLIVVCIVLLIADILTGIWYWNKLNLYFDSNEFNNIITPILSLLAFIVYSLALLFAIKQNQLILSQNLKPYYEKEIEEYKDKASRISITDGLGSNTKELGHTNYLNEIRVKLEQLKLDENYVEDYAAFKKGITFKKEYFKSRSYYDILFFLSEFAIGISPITFLYEDLKIFIQEINESKLINEDKILLKKIIRRFFLEQYLSFNYLLLRYDYMNVPFPMLYTLDEKINFKPLSETAFTEHYEWFKNELK